MYYDDILNECKKHFKNKQYLVIKELLEKELSMPFVPSKYKKEYKTILLKTKKNILINSKNIIMTII